MSQLAALSISVFFGLMIIPVAAYTINRARIMFSKKARNNAGVAIAVFVVINIAPLLSKDIWHYKSGEPVEASSFLLMGFIGFSIWLSLALFQEVSYRKRRF